MSFRLLTLVFREDDTVPSHVAGSQFDGTEKELIADMRTSLETHADLLKAEMEAWPGFDD